MAKVLEKVERRLGEKLLIKGDRCMGPKCAVVRRGYAPGVHGKSRRRRRDSSEFGALLREKQIIRLLYNLDDKDIKRYITKASSQKGVFSVNVIRMLEHRLDTAIYRLGFADSRRSARQSIVHGHITINGRIVRSPAYRVVKGAVIGIREQSLNRGSFVNLEERIKKYDPPRWFHLEKGKKTGTFVGEVEVSPEEVPADLAKIKEFYSR